MGRILATLVTILILVLGAAFAVPYFVDWNSYRPGIERTASGVLGRRVSILGDIDIVLLPEPHLHASHVAAGNGKADGALLTADAVDISLSLEALFGGRLDAGKLKLVHPVLTLDFSKPFVEADTAAGNGALPFAAGVRSVEIEGGRISVFSKAVGASEALALSRIDGAVSASQGSSYRFNGQVSKDGRQYEVKLSASPVPGKGLKLTGSAADSASKAAFHADGVLSASEDPAFEGAVAFNAPQTAAVANRLPLEVQVKSAAKIGLTDAILSDLELTIDPQNRPQVLTGSANIAFGAQKAAIALKSRSLDADALLNGSAWPDPAAGPAGDWSALAAAADNLLWLRPDYAISLDLEALQVQLKGEPVENVIVHGARMQGRWLFDQGLATLPGDAALRLAGTLTRAGQAPQLVASVSLEGKSVSRLARWLVPSLQTAGRVAGAFSVNGSLALSREVFAFESVTGSLDGTPFTAGLHVDKAPQRRLVASLAGENFDLSAFDNAESARALSPESLKSAWQGGLAQLAAVLGAGSEGFDTADIDIAAARIKTGGQEAKNVAVHVKFDPDLITVSKLSADSDSGLALRAEGSVPLRGTGQGRFGGRLEAKSPQAIMQIAALTGYGGGSLESRAQVMAPAAFSINYNAETAGNATAELDGNLGTARVEGRAELKGSLSDWRTAGISARLKLSDPDGNKLAGLFFPDAVPPRSPTPAQGVFSASVSGAGGQLQTQASLTGTGIQGQLDGVTDLKAKSFKGTASASAGMPEQFLPLPVLTLLGGERGATLRAAASITASPTRLETRELKAEAPGNLVTGNLVLETTGGITQVVGNLNAEKASLPSLFAYFLSSAPGDAAALTVPSLSSSPPPTDLWSGKPFSFPALQGTEGAILLSAKTMKLSDTLWLTDAELHASLDRGRLAIETLKGNMLGGALDAQLNLTARNSVVAAEVRVSLAHADPAAVANPGTAPLVNARASLSLSVSGQGLSPRGIISVLRGRGTIYLDDGELTKLSPAGMQIRAEELLAQPAPLTEDAVSKQVLEAVQQDDFSFRSLKIPIAVSDGVVEIRRASFRGEDATVRMEAYADLNKGLVDSTWQMGVSSDRRQKLPPVKVLVSGPLRDLGSRPRTVSAEDFIRTILVRKMEGDIARLEGLGKPPAQAKPPSAWTTRQEPSQKTKRRKQEEQPAAKAPEPAQPKSFEQRMRDALENLNGGPAAR